MAEIANEDAIASSFFSMFPFLLDARVCWLWKCRNVKETSFERNLLIQTQKIYISQIIKDDFLTIRLCYTCNLDEHKEKIRENGNFVFSNYINVFSSKINSQKNTAC